MLISPYEPPELRSIGTVSNRPEECGADILIPSRTGLIGIQRKELGDLVNSFYEGRLAFQLLKLGETVAQPVLLIEGAPVWSTDGQLLSRQKWSQAQHWGLISNLQASGCHVAWTSTLHETMRWLSWYEKWAGKKHHHSLIARPGPERVVNGAPVSRRDRHMHVLQGIEGVGPVEAGRIVDQFGGVPLTWTVTREELMLVEGIGKVTAERLVRCFDRGKI